MSRMNVPEIELNGQHPQNGLHRWNDVAVPEGLLSMVVVEQTQESRVTVLAMDAAIQGALAFARQVQNLPQAEPARPVRVQRPANQGQNGSGE